MKILIQRVSSANVKVDQTIIGEIGQGILALVGIEPHDDRDLIEKGIDKILKYRLFSDSEGKMNLSLLDVGAQLLLVSQFTLAANTNKGLRPSFTSAADPNLGKILFEHAVTYARTKIAEVETGQFGADMQVTLTNDGPVTFLLEF